MTTTEFCLFDFTGKCHDLTDILKVSLLAVVWRVLSRGESRNWKTSWEATTVVHGNSDGAWGKASAEETYRGTDLGSTEVNMLC